MTVTWSKATSSSSAAIWAMPVCTPLPRSTAPQYTVTLPSGAMASQESSLVGSGVGYRPVEVPAARAVPACRATGMLKAKTIAPLACRKWRRERPLSSTLVLICFSPLRHGGGALDGTDNRRIGAAAAQMAIHRLANLGVGGMGSVQEQVRGLDEH